MPNQTQDKLDIINEQDEVIDTQERILIHEKGLLHREIHVWFLDKDNNVIFQKRGANRSSAGLFDATVGGHVDAGENYTDTAIRESKEETSISVNTSNLILVRKFRSTSYDKDKNTTNNFLRAIFINTQPISELDIKKEAGVIDVDFKKFSFENLLHLTGEESSKFDQFILSEEIPFVEKYIKNHSL